MNTTDIDPSPSANEPSSSALAELVALIKTGGIWTTIPVTKQPSLTLTQWQVMQLSNGERHFTGWVDENQEGRASSVIRVFDAARLRGITRTGRVYQLQGPPGWDDDADHVWRSWTRINRETDWVDISGEVWAAHIEAARAGDQTDGASTP